MILSKRFHLIFAMNKLKESKFLIIEYVVYIKRQFLTIINFECFQSKDNFHRKLLFIIIYY